ncbi:hypothetical protein LIA77_01169 [Sarocladium implicatum]|nr:hypothetical protein LIA77_01169 [Sarocladium implicatum]
MSHEIMDRVPYAPHYGPLRLGQARARIILVLRGLHWRFVNFCVRKANICEAAIKRWVTGCRPTTNMDRRSGPLHRILLASTVCTRSIAAPRGWWQTPICDL